MNLYYIKTKANINAYVVSTDPTRASKVLIDFLAARKMGFKASRFVTETKLINQNMWAESGGRQDEQLYLDNL